MSQTGLLEIIGHGNLNLHSILVLHLSVQVLVRSGCYVYKVPVLLHYSQDSAISCYFGLLLCYWKSMCDTMSLTACGSELVLI